MLGLTKPFAIPTYFFVIIVFIHSLWKKIHKINIAIELKQKNPHQQKPARLNLYKSEHLASPNQRGATLHEQSAYQDRLFTPNNQSDHNHRHWKYINQVVKGKPRQPKT